MEKMVVYYNSENFVVVHFNDEAEFIARFFGEAGPDWECWDRAEYDGPVILEVPQPGIASVYETYDDAP
jgi:hypothetical protein